LRVGLVDHRQCQHRPWHWFVSGNKNGMGIDQTTTPGSRADAVQGMLGH
jgi:hypothetical protein